MGTLTIDMERLADSVRRGHEVRELEGERRRAAEAARQHTAAERAQQRAQDVMRRRYQVKQSLTDSRAKLQAEASRLRSHLQSYTHDLKSEVSTLRADIQQDLQGARAAWHGRDGAFAPVTSAPTRVAAASPVSTPQRTVTVAADQAVADDLTSISGIGPGMQERLNKAGIESFAQLASTPVAEIRAVLGELNRLAHVEEWVKEANSRLDTGQNKPAQGNPA